MKKIRKLTFIILLFFSYPDTGMAQQVRALYEKLAQTESSQDIYTSLNLCKKIIQICENTPESECWYSNIMRHVYRIKGKSEFTIYKKELKRQRLTEAINSLATSYNLYRDPEVQFLQGYLKAVQSLLEKGRPDLSGLVFCWEAILDIYARENWEISPQLVVKTKQFIEVSEKFARPGLGKNYTGVFAKYIIVLACDLMDKGNLNQTDQKYFRDIRLKFASHEGAQWQKWRNNSLPR